MGKLIQYSTSGSRFNGEWKWQAAGMGYIILTKNKHILIIDGGQTREDAENLVRICKEETGADRPAIDAWILTHPHIDHIGAAYELATDEALAASVSVGRFIFSAPDEYTFQNPARDVSREVAMMKKTVALLGAELVEPSAGDSFDFDGTILDVLFTYRDLERAVDPNELSMIFSISGDRKKAMFTGDSYFAGLDVLYKKKKAEGDLDRLKSDIVQLAHHSLNGGHTLFYKAVAADIALVPISRPGDDAMRLPEENCAHHNMYARSIAKTLILAYTGTASVEI